MEHITDIAEFDELLSGEKPILADFYAEWCGPCKMLSPVVEEFAGEHPEIVTVKVNVDEVFPLAARFGVVSVPTLIFFQNGEVAARSVGAVPKEEIEQLITV